MLKSSRNRPEYFIMADLELYQELLGELDAQMKLHVQKFFAQLEKVSMNGHWGCVHFLMA